MEKTKLLLVTYIVFIILAIIAGQQFFSFTEQSLLHFDALHYQEVKNEGYHGIEVAFFPLFPMLWKLLGASPFFISLLNGIIYFLSVFILFRGLDFSLREKILCLLTPGLVFFLVPYSEALFFLSATLLLIAVNRRDLWLTAIALLLCTLSRPSFTVLLPALLLMELFSSHPPGKWKRIFVYTTVSGIGIVLVGLIQYIDTGRWFEFFSVQSEWDNALRIPTLPLRSWAAQEIIMLDGVALLTGVVCGIILLIDVFKKKAAETPDVLKLSLAYFGGMTLLVLLFRGGSLFSLNRFLFCSPFFFVVIRAFWRSEVRVSGKQISLIFVLLLCYWLLFASYVHIQTFLKYGALSLFCLLFFFVKYNKEHVRNFSFYFLVICLCFIQLFFLFRYLNGGWVG